MPSLARNIYAHGNRFQVSLTYKCRTVFVGHFTTLDEAIAARDEFKALPDDEKAKYLPKTERMSRPKFKSDGIKLPHSYEVYQKARANRQLLSNHKYAVRRTVA